MANELKPCPFCGRKPVFNVIASSSTGILVKGIEFKIICMKCGIEFPDKYKMSVRFDLNSDNGYTIECDERQKAAEAWNRRSNDE